MDDVGAGVPSDLDVSETLATAEQQLQMDHLAELVRLALDVPIALVSAVLEDHAVVIGAAGLDADAEERRRLLTHDGAARLVTGGPARAVDDVGGDTDGLPDLDVGAYCSVPVLAEDGQVLGSVCVIDDGPREWSLADATRLERMVPVLRGQVTAFRAAARQRWAVREATDQVARVGGRLAESNRQLDAARATVDEFLGVVAHDLRSPLITALGLAETLRDEGIDELDRGVLRDSLHRSLGRSLRLLDRLHDHARAGTGPMATGPVDLNVVVRGALDDLSAGISARDVRVHQGSFLPMVRGDVDLLGQLVRNVVGNAVRYASDGVSGAEVWIDGARTDDGVHLTITDDGPGLPPETAHDVFSPGVRGARGGDGIGIGLATCRTIVERHGGRIWIDSAPGAGARVNVVLPAVDRPRRRVLIVEDDPDVLLLYAVTLQADTTAGRLAPRTARTVAAADEVIASGLLEPGDLAIVDLELPDGDGLELIRRLVEIGVQVHTVSNVSAKDARMREALALGASVSTKSSILANGFADFTDRLVGHG